MTAAIALEDAVLDYPGARALDGLSLSIEPGETLALAGPSGSGKTSVLRLILGFAAPSAGCVRLDGEPVSAAGRILRPPEERNLAVVFQDLALWPHLTVRGNLEFGLKARKVPRAEREERLQATMARMGLAGKEGRQPGQLSGGERQRVAIARALVLRPRAVLLDEPFANLDVALKAELLPVFRDLFREQKATVVHVTHDLREAAALGDRIAVIESGRLVQAGSVAELRAAPRSRFVEVLVKSS